MKILVVDDEKTIVKGIKFNLENEGYQVDVCYDGETAVDMARRGEYAVILLDLMMPKLDGLGACQQIRQFSTVPIIMLTARSEDADKIIGLESGADDYITKPFSVKLVLMRVEAVLRRAKEREVQKNASILSCGNIRLDREGHSVSAGGRPVSLTHTEYGLLELFMLHPGRVFTRDNLLNHVWGYDFVGKEKTVNIHIMNLRRKLNTDLIETIRGVGYRLGKKLHRFQHWAENTQTNAAF